MITVPEFTEVQGVAVRLPDNPKVMDFFNLYLTNEIFQLIVDETNRFAYQYFDEHPESVNSNFAGDEDICCVSNFNGYSGYKPSIPMYWSTDALYNTIFSMHETYTFPINLEVSTF